MTLIPLPIPNPSPPPPPTLPILPNSVSSSSRQEPTVISVIFTDTTDTGDASTSMNVIQSQSDFTTVLSSSQIQTQDDEITFFSPNSTTLSLLTNLSTVTSSIEVQSSVPLITTSSIDSGKRTPTSQIGTVPAKTATVVTFPTAASTIAAGKVSSTAVPNSQNLGHSGRQEIGTMIGGIVGGVLVFAIAVLMAILLWRRRVRSNLLRSNRCDELSLPRSIVEDGSSDKLDDGSRPEENNRTSFETLQSDQIARLLDWIDETHWQGVHRDGDSSTEVSSSSSAPTVLQQTKGNVMEPKNIQANPERAPPQESHAVTHSRDNSRETMAQSASVSRRVTGTTLPQYDEYPLPAYVPNVDE
ncbi:hypothetical protein M422DRAFT_239135 [Sphaerobolus stellatus SS14]|nr:hypothetical protein M422DRAFT_239135 [Sphaerobolus stellatus SS14]